jgi:acyl carrier protein
LASLGKAPNFLIIASTSGEANMAVNELEIRGKIRDFLTQNFLLGKGSVKVADGDSFLDSGLVDSTGVLEFVNFLQDVWSIQVDDLELLPENFDSVNNLTAFVVKKLS